MSSRADIYCISGLGADRQVFEHLSIPGCTFHHLNWLKPERGERMDAYARRMAGYIQRDNPVLLGMSFGGMMAVEIAKFRPLRRLWLCSTVKVRAELPGWMRLVGRLGVHKPALAFRPYRWMAAVENYNLGVEGPDERRMVGKYRRTVDPVYVNWALDKVVNWDNTEMPGNYFQIQGKRDHIFPWKRVTGAHVIDDAGHLLVHNRAELVSALLQRDLEGLE